MVKFLFSVHNITEAGREGNGPL